MASRPLVSVYGATGTQSSQLPLPDVFTTPIRIDLVKFVHTQINKNHRQPYAVALRAGHQTSAQSWGTGRAVSRIPRVRGGGTHRSGQGAFGNMCRGGRMFGATKIFRRWHRHVNLNQRRFAIAAALAASAVPALVMARGHRINEAKEIPLVIADEAANTCEKSKAALALFAAIGASGDIEKASNSKKLRAGKGKMRNRRYRRKLGPLVIYGSRTPFVRASRNLPGVECVNVRKLNLLRLAPGGQVGRLVVWTSGAFAALDKLYGSESTKKGYSIPRSKLTNADVDRIIQSDEIQSVCRRISIKSNFTPLKRNPLRNREAMLKLNPYKKTQVKLAKRPVKASAIKARQERGKAAIARRTAYYASLTQDITREDHHSKK